MSKKVRANAVELEMARIQLAIATGKISVAELARTSGIPKTTLTGITEPGWNPRAATLTKLIAGLQALLGNAKKEKTE